MITLLIIADDFTGALDTGVQFAAAGASVRVVTDVQYDYSKAEKEVQVLVMDAETRHLTSEEAYQVVFDITKRAAAHKVRHIYKKTDSALRGNIGSEMAALLDASGQKVLPFIPAFPQMGRVTKNGIHYIDGLPVASSVFGHDPFEPVRWSYIPDLIYTQSKVKVRVMKAGAGLPDETQGPMIAVYDSESQQQLMDTAGRLYREGKLPVMAGCAGFASVLPALFHLQGRQRALPEFIQQFLVICGSVNPITKEQLDYAQANGFTRIRLTPQQKLEKEYWDTETGQKVLRDWSSLCQSEAKCILDSNDENGEDTIEYAKEKGIGLEEVRQGISNSMGRILRELISRGVKSTILITGGDTLLGFMNQIGVCEMEPLCEMAPGTVLSNFNIGKEQFRVISKSGGFGARELLTDLAEEILKEKEKRALC